MPPHEESHPAPRPDRPCRVRGKEGSFLLTDRDTSTARAPVLFCTDTAWDRYADRCRAAAPGLQVVLLRGNEQVSDDDLEHLSIAFFSNDAWPDRTSHYIGACLRAPNLQWLHTFSAGVDSPVFAEFVRRGARVTTSSGSSARPIAQVAMTMILGLSRGMAAWAAAQRERRWAPHVGEEVDGCNLAVVGMGPIGVETAQLGTALGMNVRGCRRTVTGREPCDTVTFAELEGLLAWADYVVLALPLADETRGLLSAERLAMMKPTARLINVGRGPLVDEDALIAALRDGRLAGAGLDVFAVEPLPADSPLWDMPNVIITPHNSGNTDRAGARAADIFIENLAHFVRGRPMENEVSGLLASPA